MNIGKRALAWCYQRWVETPIEAWRRRQPERNYESALSEYSARTGSDGYSVFADDKPYVVSGVGFSVHPFIHRRIVPGEITITQPFTVAPVELEAGMLARALRDGKPWRSTHQPMTQEDASLIEARSHNAEAIRQAFRL